MGTRATIEINDSYGGIFYVYRGHDGFPEIIIPDVQAAIDLLESRNFRGAEASHLTTVLLGRQYDEQNSVPDYEITSGWHGDESYRYACHYDKEAKRYSVKVIGQ